MRLVSFEHKGKRSVGAIVGSDLADLSTGRLMATDMIDLIAGWDEESVAAAVDEAARVPLSNARLLAPLRMRRNVIGVGRNYRDHAKEFSESGFDASERGMIPDSPVIFSKAATSVIGPNDAIVLANDPTHTTDYEGELAVVLGRQARHVRREEALSFVFGWTIVNDVTARELQKRHVQWFVGKSPDTFCPMGPSITTREELPDIRSSWIHTRVNGELRQEAPLSALIFDVESLIVTLSAALTLHPGDVIATGTPLGVGIGFEPPRFLASGDVVEVTVEGIGTLRNPVR